MPAPKIGANAALLSTRANLDFALGQKVAAVIEALRDAHQFKLMLDAYADSEIAALGYNTGLNGTANEVGYLRSGLVACADLDLIRQGLAPQVAVVSTPHNYQGDLAYLSPN